MSVSIDILNRSYSRCLIFLACLLGAFSFLSPYFLSLSNVDNILSASAVIGLLALGSTFILAAGGIDLSIGSVMALSGTAAASLLKITSIEMPIVQLLFFALICLACGAVCGAITGALTNFTKAPSFIVSLGMLSVYRGVAFITADGGPVFSIPQIITDIGQGMVFGISFPVVVLLAAAGLSFVILHLTKFGVHALAFGDKASAAEAMGVDVSLLRLKVFTLTGSLAGLAGFIFTARTSVGDPAAGQGYELMAITAVVLGGTKLFGGQAHILGTLLGVVCLGTLQNGLNLLAVSAYYQLLFVGAVLISASILERIGGNR